MGLVGAVIVADGAEAKAEASFEQATQANGCEKAREGTPLRVRKGEANEDHMPALEKQGPRSSSEAPMRAEPGRGYGAKAPGGLLAWRSCPTPLATPGKTISNGARLTRSVGQRWLAHNSRLPQRVTRAPPPSGLGTRDWGLGFVLVAQARANARLVPRYSTSQSISPRRSAGICSQSAVWRLAWVDLRGARKTYSRRDFENDLFSLITVQPSCFRISR